MVLVVAIAALIVVALVAARVLTSLGAVSAPAANASAFGQAAIEKVESGYAVDVVLVDDQDHDAAVAGEMDVQLRQTGGQIWESRQAVTPAQFKPLPATSLLAGRVGYSVTAPSSAWTTPPSSGTPATILVTATPRSGPPITGQVTTVFP